MTGVLRRVTGLALLAGLVLYAAVSWAGWLKPSRQGFIIQTYTSREPITGSNSGVILTNGNSFQIAADNTGVLDVSSAGTQFRGENDGGVRLDAAGALVLGEVDNLASVTNLGSGAIVICRLSAGQQALVTAVGHASLLLGAGTVSNAQCIVVGDGNVSHGARSVTADSFHGDAAEFDAVKATQIELGGVTTNAWPSGADDLGNHTATEGVDLAGYKLFAHEVGGPDAYLQFYSEDSPGGWTGRGWLDWLDPYESAVSLLNIGYHNGVGSGSLGTSATVTAWQYVGTATGGQEIVNFDAMTNYVDPLVSAVVSGGRFQITWNGPTSTIYVVSSDGTYTNKVGDFYGL